MNMPVMTIGDGDDREAACKQTKPAQDAQHWDEDGEEEDGPIHKEGDL